MKVDFSVDTAKIPLDQVIMLTEDKRGKGGSGEVVVGKMQDVQGGMIRLYAVKIVKPEEHNDWGQLLPTATMPDSAAREVLAASILASRSDMFVGPIAAGWLQGSNERCLVYELFEQSLEDRLQQTGPAAVEMVKQYTRQVLQCLDVLYSGELGGWRVLNRDIKVCFVQDCCQ